MSSLFHHRLQSLKDLLLGMGGTVESQLRMATLALTEGTPGFAEQAIAADRDVDALENTIDEACVELLALYQPAAVDLRFIAVAMKVVTELERIGDQAANIARAAQAGPLGAALVGCGLPAMANAARTMVAESLDALARNDAALARKVIADDDALDELEQALARRLMEHADMEHVPLEPVFRLANAARCLERIGDHATNVAELTLYSTEALLVRHPTVTA